MDQSKNKLLNSSESRKRVNPAASQRSKRSRASVPPGSVIDSSNRAAQLVFKHINDNEWRQLQTMLGHEGANINVTLLKESRMYTALSFAAFKNHP